MQRSSNHTNDNEANIETNDLETGKSQALTGSTHKIRCFTLPRLLPEPGWQCPLQVSSCVTLRDHVPRTSRRYRGLSGSFHPRVVNLWIWDGARRTMPGQRPSVFRRQRRQPRPLDVRMCEVKLLIHGSRKKGRLTCGNEQVSARRIHLPVEY